MKKWFLVILYIAFILGLSSIPGKEIKILPQWRGADKAGHALLYTGLGYILERTTTPFCAIVLGFGVGALDENYQRFTPGRDTSKYDWMADAVGILLGISIARVWRKRKSRS
ncbi:MAG: VanZ family protein [Verrucomicrobiota bacterium]